MDGSPSRKRQRQVSMEPREAMRRGRSGGVGRMAGGGDTVSGGGAGEARGDRRKRERPEMEARTRWETGLAIRQWAERLAREGRGRRGDAAVDWRRRARELPDLAGSGSSALGEGTGVVRRGSACRWGVWRLSVKTREGDDGTWRSTPSAGGRGDAGGGAVISDGRRSSVGSGEARRWSP